MDKEMYLVRETNGVLVKDTIFDCKSDAINWCQGCFRVKKHKHPTLLIRVGELGFKSEGLKEPKRWIYEVKQGL